MEQCLRCPNRDKLPKQRELTEVCGLSAEPLVGTRAPVAPGVAPWLRKGPVGQGQEEHSLCHVGAGPWLTPGSAPGQLGDFGSVSQPL